MAKKKSSLDAQTLLRNRFWIILGVTVPLILVAMIFLTTLVAADLDKRRRDIDKSKRELDARKTLRETQKELEALTEQEKKLQVRREEVWAEAWKIQSDLMTWPAPLRQLDSLHFGEPIDDKLRDAFIQDNAYKAQVEEVVRIPEPVLFKDGWEKVVVHVPKFDVARFQGPPTPEEMWLAEEDIWVQRELFLAIKQANDYVAKFTRLESGDATPKPDPAKRELFRQRFRNPRWELDLILARNVENRPVLRGTIKNVSKQRQLLGRVNFLVWLNEDETAKPEELSVQGESLAADESAPLKLLDEDRVLKDEVVVKDIDPKGIFAVRQVLDVASAPVKRIDRIVIGQHSHRTYQPELKPPSFSKVTAPRLAMTPASGPVRPDTPAPGDPIARPADAHLRTDNGVLRFRYMEVSPQVRRLPLAMVLVVDSAHIQGVLTALANSKLRLQTTQVDWHRTREKIRPPEPAKPKEPAPPMTGAPERPGAAAAMEEPPMSLVELAYYGIASLYERYPPKAPPRESDDTSAGRR
ncbi:MAG: hypothetical protein NZ700_03090 [Gemmataceae bacterium]|nr:hypothetical protein [Gemmataceae bacterium]MDW8265915.1 hypothetical protein [Gemmataceae bacterium]